MLCCPPFPDSSGRVEPLPLSAVTPAVVTVFQHINVVDAALPDAVVCGRDGRPGCQIQRRIRSPGQTPVVPSIQSIRLLSQVNDIVFRSVKLDVFHRAVFHADPQAWMLRPVLPFAFPVVVQHYPRTFIRHAIINIRPDQLVPDGIPLFGFPRPDIGLYAQPRGRRMIQNKFLKDTVSPVYLLRDQL